MSLIAKMHVAKKQLGLDDDTYRDTLELVTGKRSAKDMNDRQRVKVLEHFQTKGFDASPVKPKADGRKKLTGKYAGKLQALWIAGWNLGLVKNKDDAALLAFVKRQTGIDHTRFLRDGDDAYKAIEAMKKWLERAGVDWTSPGDTAPDFKRTAGFKIAIAQFAKLDDSMATKHWFEFTNAVGGIVGRHVRQMVEESDWHPVMNTFGERIRADKKDAK